MLEVPAWHRLFTVFFVLHKIQYRQIRKCFPNGTCFLAFHKCSAAIFCAIHPVQIHRTDLNRERSREINWLKSVTYIVKNSVVTLWLLW